MSVLVLLQLPAGAACNSIQCLLVGQCRSGKAYPWRDLYTIDEGTLTVIGFTISLITGAVGPGLLLVHDNVWSVPRVGRHFLANRYC